ncbi:F0F1 ATP synthase subunit A [Candidatus Uhrbacteria bacterium]|nr:F0F1 ATP synthase subunit A [Candidatus Uhrbacteria bacterium]
MNISVAAEKIFSVLGLPITNSMLVAWIAMGFLVIISLVATHKIRLVPRGLQNFFESVCDAILTLVDSVMGDRKQSLRFFPLIATIFIFVLVGNWLGLLPGVGSVGIREYHEGREVLVPFLRSTAADLNFTLALAVISVITVQVVGILSVGFFKYASKFINFSSPLNFFVGVLELISEVAKLISFSFRLFGNIFAGEVLLTVMFFLVPYVVPLPFMMFEVFVGFIQAMVFSMLTLVFLKIATIEAQH